ncbi:hypothetical protein CLU79DRAFT_835174 [Phycomyces nitens]|nr:hypothetical protein CLU79DRAFT_835174 [Phycomyces nitens]
MDISCARVSDESVNFLGVYPQEITHRSLYDLISPEYSSQLARLHRCLLDNANISSQDPQPASLRTNSDAFNCSPSILLSIANGSQTFKDSLAFRRPDGTSELMDVRFYIGGGLGADLFVPKSLDRLYAVCLLTRSDSTPIKPLVIKEPRPVSKSSASGSSLLDHEPTGYPFLSSSSNFLPMQKAPISAIHHQTHSPHILSSNPPNTPMNPVYSNITPQSLHLDAPMFPLPMPIDTPQQPSFGDPTVTSMPLYNHNVPKVEFDTSQSNLMWLNGMPPWSNTNRTNVAPGSSKSSQLSTHTTWRKNR